MGAIWKTKMIQFKSMNEEESFKFKGLDRTFSKFGKRVTFDYWTRDTVVRVPNGCCGVVRQIRRRKGNDVVVALFKVKIK